MTREFKMNEENISGLSICTLCPRSNIHTQAHYLHDKLTLSYCDCSRLGGLFFGFCDEPYWKFYSDISREEFFNYANSAQAYVEIMRELH